MNVDARARLSGGGSHEAIHHAVAATLIALGADSLTAAGLIGAELAEALRTESRRRAEEGRFYGQIAYASLIARRPA